MSQVKPLVHDLNNKLQVIMGAHELGSLETALLACNLAKDVLEMLTGEIKTAIQAKLLLDDEARKRNHTAEVGDFTLHTRKKS